MKFVDPLAGPGLKLPGSDTGGPSPPCPEDADGAPPSLALGTIANVPLLDEVSAAGYVMTEYGVAATRARAPGPELLDGARDIRTMCE